MRIAALEARLGELDQALASAGYLIHSGRRARSDTARVYEEFAGLLTADNVKTARMALQECTVHTGAVERRRRARILLAIASHWIEAQVAPLKDRLTTRRREVQVPFPGGAAAYLRASEIVSSEPLREARSEQWKILGETARREVAPLALELWQARESLARGMGYSSYLAMFARLQCMQPEDLRRQVRTVLALSAETYRHQVAMTLQDIAGAELPCATSADLIYALRQLSEQSELAGVDTMGAVRTTLAGLGMALDELPQLRYDIETHPGKDPRAAIFFVNPPHESVISCYPLGGLTTARAVMHETGHGLHVSLMDPDLPVALRRIPDLAIAEAMAFLFDGLVCEPAWLRDIAGIDARRAHAIAERQTLYRRVQTRLICAQALYEMELSRDLSEASARQYQRCFSEGAMVLYHPGGFLNNRDTELYSFNYFRGLQLEAIMREYLQQRFGQAWWRDRRAGQRLKEIWWHGHNWTPLTLARACGASAVTPGPLIRRLNRHTQAVTGSAP